MLSILSKFGFILTLSVVIGSQVLAQRAPEQDYLVYVVCESADKIVLIRFGPKGIKVEKEIPTGAMFPDIDGPHGIVVSPDKQYYYVSLGHGRPFGSVWKYSTKDDAVIKKVTLGYFPATMDISANGSFLYVVNFNLHGDMVPSTVSIVATELMMEITRVTTCMMPHGSRINPQGDKQYSVCMMDDMLAEIDLNTFKVSRHFMLTKGKELGMTGAPSEMGISGEAKKHDMSGHGLEPPKPGDTGCSPTWAQPSADGKFVYIACNKSDEVVEVDSTSWKMTRRIPVRGGVYNLAITKDNRLITTNKRDQSVSIVDLKTGKELARLATKRKVVHGAVVTPDGRYAFITVEGIGAEPGTVEVIDLEAMKTVATLDVPQQAAGIDFYKTEPLR